MDNGDIMKNSEIFYFDIDGTLLDNDSKQFHKVLLRVYTNSKKKAINLRFVPVEISKEHKRLM